VLSLRLPFLITMAEDLSEPSVDTSHVVGDALDATGEASTPLAKGVEIVRRLSGDVENTSAATGKQHETDVTIKTALMSAKAKDSTFVGMPKISWQIWKTWEQTSAMAGMVMKMEPHELTLLDARKRELAYRTCGFCLMPLVSEVTNWQAAATVGTPENTLYSSELDKVIKQLHPQVKKITYMAFLLRGGQGENKPAAGTVHLDMWPDPATCEAWNAKNEKKGHKKKADADVSDGFSDDGLELGMVLGLWKPRQANPTYDYPLFMCDASTLSKDDCIPQYQRFENISAGKVQTVVNVAGSIKYSAQHQWYYYSEQTKDELIVFRHKTTCEPYLVNYHAAAQLPLPDGAEKRASIETRAFLFFEKGAVASKGLAL